MDAERISLAFTEAIRGHTSRGGAEPYLRFARIRMGSLIGANSLIRHSFTCHRVSALFLLNHILAILFSKFILCISVLSLLFLVVRIPCWLLETLPLSEWLIGYIHVFISSCSKVSFKNILLNGRCPSHLFISSMSCRGSTHSMRLLRPWSLAQINVQSTDVMQVMTRH